MITNGVISFEDGNKAVEEFAPARKVRVEIHFAMEPNSTNDGTDELNAAGVIAKAKVYELLGMAAPAGKSASFKQGEAAAKVADAAPDQIIDPPAPTDKPKGKPGRKAAPKATEPADETDGIGGETTAAPASTIMEGLEEEPQTVVLSDKALYDTVVAINGKIKKPAEITAIVGKYCPNDGTPPSVRRIPEAKRPAFLKEIEAFAATFAKK